MASHNRKCTFIQKMKRETYRFRMSLERDWSFKNHTNSKKNIELIPEKSSEFDFFSLLELCKFLQEDYCADPITKLQSVGKYYFYIYNNYRRFGMQNNGIQKDNDRWTFFISIELPSFQVHVFIRYHLHDFKFVENPEKFLEICKTKDTNKGQFNKETPLQVLTAFCTNRNHPCPNGIRFYFNALVNKYASQKFPTIKAQNDEIENILKKCLGDVMAVFYTEEKGNNEKSRLCKVSIIFPWAKNFFQLINYLELDASFTAMKPYAFCVAQGILFNESIPLSITITESESNDLYRTVLNRFQEVFEKQLHKEIAINWKEKIVLSDMGKAICAICKEFGITHFFCHRHILEHFGSGSALGFIVQQILYCFSYDNCKKLIEKLRYQVQEYKNMIVQLYGKVSSSLQMKLDEIETMMNLEKGNPDSNYYFKKWAMWIRSEYSVPRCSNHNESLHRFLNRDVDPSEIIVTKLDKLIHNVIQHYLLLPKRMGTSIDRKINEQIQYLLSRLKEATFDIFSYIAQNKENQCNCAEEGYNMKIYGCKIPCQHHLLANAVESLEQLFECLSEAKCNLQFNQCLSLILENINSNPLEILSQFNLSSTEKNAQIMSLIGNIIQDFHPKKPEIPHFPINWSYQSYERKDEIVENIENLKPKNKVGSKGSPFIINTPLSSIYRHPEISESENEAYKALIETATQIQKTYGSMDFLGRILPLCFGEYQIRFPTLNCIHMDETELYKWIAQFKIACFLRADELYQQDRGRKSQANHYKLLRNE